MSIEPCENDRNRFIVGDARELFEFDEPVGANFGAPRAGTPVSITARHFVPMIGIAVLV